MNFFNIIRKSTNKSLSDLQDSAIYEIAAEKLEPKPYAQQAKPLFLLSKYFSVAYHFISYIIALIGITLYALQLDSLIYQIILVLLSFILLFVVEVAKGNASNNVFSSKARKEQPNQLFLGILVITTIFSFVTSVWSAKEAVYYASTDTKFSNIDSLQNSQIDSVNSLFATQISSLESSIKASQNVLQSTKTNWKINTAQKDLKEAQTTLTNLLQSKEKALLSISKSTESKKGTTDTNGLFIAKLAAVIFLLFESLNLIGYWFLYQYYSNVLLEKDLVLNRLSKSLTNAVHDVSQTVTTAVNNLAHTTVVPNTAVVPNAVPTTAVHTTAVPSQVTAVSKPQTIGFKIPSQTVSQVSQTTAVPSVPNSVPNLQTAVLNGNRLCKHCQKPYIYKQAKQKFCSSECRITNWKQTTGKSFVKGKKGGKTV